MTDLLAQPAFTIPHGAHFDLQGLVGTRLRKNVDQWLLTAPQANPAMLQMFRDRDRKPRRDLVPWAGEFAGKYLTSAVLALRLSSDGRLQPMVDSFVEDLIATQDTDGYLGPAPHDQRLIGTTLAGDWLWDIWGHYHCMLGLLLYFRETGNPSALQACRKGADLLCRRFLQDEEKVISAKAEEMNMAVAHVLCLLYEETGESDYLSLARVIEKEWQMPPAGDYVRAALQGMDFYQLPKPRWESLHDIQAIVELYYITGDPQYRIAFEHLWHSMVRTDRHNSGGFSSGEAAVGSPYDPRAIETCCSIAWLALSVDMLRLTGDSRVADEIELSTFNAILGAQHPSGRWWTYNTPMDGVRKASAHEIVFQSREGSPELNCCSVNGPRGLGMVSEWAVMQCSGGLVVNYYGPGTMTAPLSSGPLITLQQKTQYPQDGHVELMVRTERPVKFDLRLRIPGWSAETQVWVNRVERRPAPAGHYLSLEREWKTGDTVDIVFDLSPHVWPGECEATGKVSIYRGPLLLVYDRLFNPLDPVQLPAVSARNIRRMVVDAAVENEAAWVHGVIDCEGPHELVLIDFASAGATGTPYQSWIPAVDLKGSEREALRISPFYAPFSGERKESITH